MSAKDEWRLSGAGPEYYELYQVPSMFEPLAHMFLERVGLESGQSVLDVACGTGIVTRLAAAIVGTKGKVVGVDFNEGMLEVARKKAPTTGAKMEWMQGDAGALPCEDATFDIVLCQQGLQFFPDKVRALREMHRVLTPDGRVWLAVWRSSEHSPVNQASTEVLGRYLGQEAAKISLAPFSLGNADELRFLLTSAGFLDVEIEATVVERRMLPPEVSIPAQLTSLPIGAQIAALDEATRSSIVAEISEALAGYLTEEGMSVPQGTHIVSAGK